MQHMKFNMAHVQHITAFITLVEMIMCIFCSTIGHARAEIIITRWIGTDSENGPLVNIHCRLMHFYTSSYPTYRWIFSNKTLVENNTLIEADPTRHSVEYFNYYGPGHRLLIRNALKEDAGQYQCQVEHYQNGALQIDNDSITVSILDYLPPLNYPECSIAPPGTVRAGNEATFSCTVGEANTDVNLQMMLQRQSGPSIDLGNTTVVKQVTADDDNATFFCFMTSDTFPKGNRTCSAMPLLVLPLTTATTTSSTMNNFSKKTTPTMMLLPTGKVPLWSITGGIIGVIILIILTLIIVCTILRFKKSKMEDARSLSPNVTDNRMTHSTENVYSAETICGVDRYATTPNNGSSGNHQPNQNDASQIPVYALVHKTNLSMKCSSNSREADTSGYEDTNLSSPAAASSMPIYSTVNKDGKTKVIDGDEDEESSGFVDNIVYVPSGPF